MNAMLRSLLRCAKPLLCVIGLAAPHQAALAVNWVQSEIEGSDSNADGVRDDVAEFIEQQWQDPGLRAWAMEAARAGQAYLMSNGNPYALHRANAFMTRARRCLTETRSPDQARLIINSVLGAQLNSYERRQSYQKALDLWVHKVQHQDLPSKPDDNWTAECGPRPGSGPRIFEAGEPAGNLPELAEQDENLPPPNFFLGDSTQSKDPAPSGSVIVKPLPTAGASEGSTNLSQLKAAAAGADAPGGWTTYSPRQRPAKASEPPSRDEPSSLPVQKLEAGQSTASLPQPASSAPVQARAAPAKRRPVRIEYSRPVPGQGQSGPALPPNLEELAPYIRSIERR